MNSRVSTTSRSGVKVEFSGSFVKFYAALNSKRPIENTGFIETNFPLDYPTMYRKQPLPNVKHPVRFN